MSPAAAGRLLKELGNAAEEVDVEGDRMWVLTDRGAVPRPSKKSVVRLLPAFDQYVIASTRHADRLMDGPFRDRVYRPQGWVSPVILVDGMIAGVWKQEKSGVSCEPFGEWPDAVGRAAAAQARRLEEYTS